MAFIKLSIFLIGIFPRAEETELAVWGENQDKSSQGKVSEWRDGTKREAQRPEEYPFVLRTEQHMCKGLFTNGDL